MLASDYKIFVAPGTVHEDIFKTAKTPLWQKAWTERIEPHIGFYKEYMDSNYHINFKLAAYFMHFNCR